eukprot:m.108883 g.108883  ORF g.108883 m.108883 type:complete len:322 (+) comp21233_c0_seq1:39-1004(+)
MMAGEGEGGRELDEVTALQPAKRRRVKSHAPPQPVCILPARALPVAGGEAVQVVTLSHPGTGKPAQFVITNAEPVEVFELATFSDSICRSWFAHDTVIQDGELLIGTVVDPVLLALPLLCRARDTSESFLLLDHILDDAGFPEFAALEHCASIHSRVAQVCDVRGSDDFRAYRLSDTKVMLWLNRKVKAVATKLETTQITSIASAAHSSNFARSAAKSKPTSAQLTRYALGVVLEYVPPPLAQKFVEFMGCLDAAASAVVEPIAPEMKTVSDNVLSEPLEDYSTATSKHVPKKAPTVVQKKLSKINTKGMKSLSAFFTKKK